MNNRQYFEARVNRLMSKTNVEILEHWTIEELDELHIAAGKSLEWRWGDRRDHLIELKKEIEMPCHTKHKFGLKSVINDGVKLYNFECARCHLRDIIVAKLFWRRTA